MYVSKLPRFRELKDRTGTSLESVEGNVDGFGVLRGKYSDASLPIWSLGVCDTSHVCLVDP